MKHRTLLLSPWYMPMKVIPWEAAVKMKYEATVDVVVEYQAEVRSPSVTWQVPAVVRLRKLERQLARGVKYSRLAVYQRDGFRCQYCGDRFGFRALTRDHVVPRAHGGRTTWTNTVAACRECNQRKGDFTCDEAGMWPLTPPRRPASLGYTPPELGRDVPPEWEGFAAGLGD
jgi:5-methylcytosine-specific restriction endonuclease McrA